MTEARPEIEALRKPQRWPVLLVATLCVALLCAFVAFQITRLDPLPELVAILGPVFIICGLLPALAFARFFGRSGQLGLLSTAAAAFALLAVGLFLGGLVLWVWFVASRGMPIVGSAGFIFNGAYVTIKTTLSYLGAQQEWLLGLVVMLPALHFSGRLQHDIHR